MVFLQNSSVYNNKEIGVLIKMSSNWLACLYITIAYISKQDYNQLKSVTRKSILQGRKEMFYFTTHSTHFIYGYIASDIW